MILTFICRYSGMNGKVVVLIPLLLDQEVILLRQSVTSDGPGSSISAHGA